jgi:hypothetical protein
VLPTECDGVFCMVRRTISLHSTKGKAIPVQAHRGPWGCQEAEATGLRQSAYEGKVSPTHRPPLPPGNIPGTRFYYRLSRPPWPWCGRKVMSMANSSASTRNPTCDLPVCTAVQLCHRVPPCTELTELSVTGGDGLRRGTKYGYKYN